MHPHLPREMRHLLWRMCTSQGDDASPVVGDRISRVGAASPAGNAVSSQEDVGASSNFWICDTTQLQSIKTFAFSKGDC